LLGQCPGQRRKQFEGGIVGPLQVVEEERGRMPSRDGRHGQPDRLEQRGRVAFGSRRTELG
jgi:hypothetical protein